jgi:hypothetical protein
VEESPVREVDYHQAAAEALLDRVDADPDPEQLEAPEQRDGVSLDGYGFHEDDPEVDLLDEDLDAGLRDDAEADALDAIAEAFNARHLEELVDLLAADAETPGFLGHDRANVADAIESFWKRRPSLCLARGHADAEHVGVLWEHDGAAWWRLAVLHVDDVRDGRVGVIEITDDPALLERVRCEPPADDDLEEGARWAEWEDGATD